MPSTTTQGQEAEAEAAAAAIRGSKCQDCGNQAKKECSYWRCRTCCKNKGFNCQTHVKSTWIPVDRRRYREDHPSPSTNPLLFHGDTSKRHKHNPYSSGVEEFKFPAATNSMAVFRCVQVRSMDDAVNEIAYQTSVNIGGHVFSGILYDQGPDQSVYAKGDSSTGPLIAQHHNLTVVSASTQTHDGAIMAPLSAAPPHYDPNLLPPPYPFPLASFRPGMPYFSYPKP